MDQDWQAIIDNKPEETVFHKLLNYGDQLSNRTLREQYFAQLLHVILTGKYIYRYGEVIAAIKNVFKTMQDDIYKQAADSPTREVHKKAALKAKYCLIRFEQFFAFNRKGYFKAMKEEYEADQLRDQLEKLGVFSCRNERPPYVSHEESSCSNHAFEISDKDDISEYTKHHDQTKQKSEEGKFDDLPYFSNKSKVEALNDANEQDIAIARCLLALFDSIERKKEKGKNSGPLVDNAKETYNRVGQEIIRTWKEEKKYNYTVSFSLMKATIFGRFVHLLFKLSEVKDKAALEEVKKDVDLWIDTVAAPSSFEYKYSRCFEYETLANLKECIDALGQLKVS